MVRLGLVALVLAVVMVALVVWDAARVWRFLVAAALVIRHIPIAAFAFFRWRVLAVEIGLGRWVRGRHSGKRKAREAPWVTRWHPTVHGYQFRLWLRRGDSMPDVTSRIEALSLGLRGTVRLSPVPGKPWRVTVTVQRQDPFAKRVAPPRALSATRLQVGVTELGAPFILDFRVNPHLLLTGATNSGKSGGISALLLALVPTDAVIVMIDLKHGISAAPMAPRASVIAENRVDASQVLADLLKLGEARAHLVKAAGKESVYELPEPMQDVWLFCDEVHELAAPAKDPGAEAMGRLLSCAQLLRALGVHVIVSGQRFGSSTGAKVTDIRAQLGGRVAFRCNDAETAAMALADVASEAAFAALEIPANRPGVAVSNTGPDRWEVVRFAHVPHADLGPAALANAHRRADWSTVTAVPAQDSSVLALVKPTESDVA